MKLRDGKNDDETQPMLANNDRMSGVHGTIDLDEKISEEKSNSSLLAYIRARFRWLYVILGFLVLLALAVLVVGLMLLLTVKKMDKKYQQESTSASERFMRMYEDAMRPRDGHVDTASIVKSLTPEQSKLAASFGLLPSSAARDGDKPTAPIDVPPIAPITASPTTKPINAETNAEQSNAQNGFYRHQWHDATCQIQCNKADITIPPLLIISLDGFNHKYLERKLVPTLDSMADCGARAKFVFPSYPSKTFPNHYTIATGLYPEAHGIVDNGVYDPKISPVLEDMKKTKFSQFYGGEPVTYI
jgi:hypothetical protein